MSLWEIRTNRVGFAEVRAYAWAPDADAAKVLYWQRNHDGPEIADVVELFSADRDQFCTKADDCGWEM